MVFDCSDIDLLRLTGFLKNLPLGQEEKYSLRLLTPAVLRPLQEFGYIALTRNGLSYSLKPAGYDFLCSLGFDYPQDKRQPSHLPELYRRFESASVFLTFYRAGMEVFSPQLSGLRSPLSYVHGSVIRRDPSITNAKLFGGCRFSGIARMGNMAYAVHFIDEGRMCYSTELRLLQNAIHPFGCHAGLMFARGSYLEAARLIAAEPPEEKSRNDSVTYREAYEKTSLPVHLLECSDAGAFQLRVMALEDYRARMTESLLGKGHLPPDPNIPDSDGLLADGNTRLPFVLSMDMDLKRIDRAYQAAREAGYRKLALGALEPQAKALQLLYQVTGKAVVYSVAIGDLLNSLRASGQSELADTLRLYEPPAVAYITPEGGVLHASDFPLHRKGGEPYRPEVWPLDGEKGQTP